MTNHENDKKQPFSSPSSSTEANKPFPSLSGHIHSAMSALRQACRSALFSRPSGIQCR